MSQPESQSSESEHNQAERKKSNLAFAFFCMEKDRAKDMEIFYAFCRLMDDIADEETQPLLKRRQQLQDWKKEIDWLVNWHNKRLTKEEYGRLSELLEYIQARLYELEK